MSAIFRQKALAKLRSPEQLDEPLKVIMRRTRLGWWTLAVTIALGLTWAWLGTLPETGRGQGILMTPNTVVPVQARAGGQVGVWHVNVGDRVRYIVEAWVPEHPYEESHNLAPADGSDAAETG